MNKYEFTKQHFEYYQCGLFSIKESMDKVIAKWAEDNGGVLNADELADIVDYLEDIEWWSLSHFMHGYIWGASTDNEWELKGEQLRKTIK